MALNVRKEVTALQRMTVRELRTRYAEVFGEETKAGNKPWLIKRIAWRLQSLEEGDLSERARQRAAELANDADVRLSPPKPKSALPAAASRTKTTALAVKGDDRLPPAGTIITREYKGQSLQVKVLSKGFEFEGEVYKTISAVAKAITGQHCNGTVCDPCENRDPFYIYRYDNCSYHLSYMDDAGYRELGQHADDVKATISVGWPSDYTKLPVIRRFAFAPHVNSRDDKMPVELIGPVDAPGGNGPSNGMYALQKELRNRIDEGLDWLSIKSLPASKGALPWFWNWADRRYAAWWDSEGLPFVQGPNMLFTNSASPRIDAEECALLDATNCRAMFCHSEWYRDLIAKHRGPANQSPIVLWPYTIDPWPEGPAPDKYDLLIYAKNGDRPQLLEHLADAVPRHIQIHYGQYRREELYEAARHSRACAYLADDDHGPLALQEILLSGCPAVGVRTGASFVRDGETGILVERHPPGRKSIANDDDAAALETYMGCIGRAQAMDRHAVREFAADEFGTARIVDVVLTALDTARRA